ncbi:MAG TPA: DUF2837 family protein [Longimicrobiales bacterium]
MRQEPGIDVDDRRRIVAWMVGSRFAGTVLAQLLLVPAAVLIVRVAEWI